MFYFSDLSIIDFMKYMRIECQGNVEFNVIFGLKRIMNPSVILSVVHV